MTILVVQVRLTKQEIARLVRLAWNDEPLAKLPDVLSEQPNVSLRALAPDLGTVNRAINELGLSVKVYGDLMDYDTRTIGELALKTELEILRALGENRSNKSRMYWLRGKLQNSIPISTNSS